MSPRTNSMLRGRFCSTPVLRLSSTTIFSPASINRWAMWLPMYPAPPVINTLMVGTPRQQSPSLNQSDTVGPPDTDIAKARFAHLCRTVDVAQVHHQGCLQRCLDAREIQRPELIPFGQDHHPVGAVQRVIG